MIRASPRIASRPGLTQAWTKQNTLKFGCFSFNLNHLTPGLGPVIAATTCLNYRSYRASERPPCNHGSRKRATVRLLARARRLTMYHNPELTRCGAASSTQGGVVKRSLTDVGPGRAHFSLAVGEICQQCGSGCRLARQSPWLTRASRYRSNNGREAPQPIVVTLKVRLYRRSYWWHYF